MFHIIALVGRSGSGKSTLQNKASEKLGFEMPQGVVTREDRGDNSGYEYVTPEQFLSRVDPNDIFEYIIYNKNLYGFTIKQFCMTDYNIIVLTPDGLEQMVERFGRKNITAIYIESTEEQQRERMLSRGDNKANVESRIIGDRKTFKDAFHVTDYKITSSTPEQDFRELCGIIREIEEERELI